MASVTQVTRTCDVCGDAKDVKARTFELDGTAYEIDLCRKHGDALGRVAAGYIAKARKVTPRPSQRRHGGRPRSRTASPAKTAGARQQKGIYVYGILPADIEVAAGIPGVGEHPGSLHDVSLDGLAALISEVDLSGRLGSPGDLKTHREILDAAAAEVPVLPLSFGTVLSSEDAVSDDLLAARHDEFAATLDRLEGRAEFKIRGRYVQDVDPAEIAARREEDTRAVQRAMEGVCVASVAREPADERDAVHVAFLVDMDKERDVERVTDDLARDWDGRVEVQLLGPMAAYDFTGTAEPES